MSCLSRGEKKRLRGWCQPDKLPRLYPPVGVALRLCGRTFAPQKFLKKTRQKHINQSNDDARSNFLRGKRAYLTLFAGAVVLAEASTPYCLS